jgi:hypothetical protein
MSSSYLSSYSLISALFSFASSISFLIESISASLPSMLEDRAFNYSLIAFLASYNLSASGFNKPSFSALGRETLSYFISAMTFFSS